MSIKPLILSTADGGGGAARAALRLHQSLLSIGVDSQMLVQSGNSAFKNIIGPLNTGERISASLRPYLDNMLLRFYRKRSRTTWSVSLFHTKLYEKIKRLKPDVVHMHWINGGFISIKDIGSLRGPVFWTLHDMWPITGGCHYTADCRRYHEQCGTCPQLGSSRIHDLSRWQWKWKQKAWGKVNLRIIASSRWMKECVHKSSLLVDKPITVIPNPIDTDLFRPIDMKIARTILNLPRDKRLVLFSAFRANHENRKGGYLLADAFNILFEDYRVKDTELVVLGAEAPLESGQPPAPTHYFGYFHDDISQVLLYSAVDLTVAPSIQENLSMAVMESLSCGTCCVAFNIGGMPDMIEHLSTGYLAEAVQADELDRGMAKLLGDDTLRDELSTNARNSSIQRFSMDTVAKRVVREYQNALL